MSLANITPELDCWHSFILYLQVSSLFAMCVVLTGFLLILVVVYTTLSALLILSLGANDTLFTGRALTVNTSVDLPSLCSCRFLQSLRRCCARLPYSLFNSWSRSVNRFIFLGLLGFFLPVLVEQLYSCISSTKVLEALLYTYGPKAMKVDDLSG